MAIQLGTHFASQVLAHDGTAGQSAVADLIGGGTLVIYSGTEPATVDTALSGNTALATFTFSAGSSQGSVTSGALSLVFSNQTVTAANSGTATFFRIITSASFTPAASTAVIQGTISTSGADFNLSSTTITSGDNVTITGTATIAFNIT